MTERAAQDEHTTGLPLVLITVGNDAEEFLALNKHLKLADLGPKAGFQSLVVAKPEMPHTMVRALIGRIKSLDNVHLRRLSDTQCEVMKHETGTFLASKLHGRRN
ncbi:MAG: hypothetical protein AAFX10_12225 [Pseudomonadota bacterium]